MVTKVFILRCDHEGCERQTGVPNVETPNDARARAAKAGWAAMDTHNGLGCDDFCPQHADDAADSPCVHLPATQ